MRGPLTELQAGACFYCGLRLGGRADVDHFIPWSRYADDGLDNLVAAHPACNNSKRDFLVSAEHVEHWAARLQNRRDDVEAIARTSDGNAMNVEAAPSRRQSTSGCL